VGHVEERGLLHAASAPVIEARDGEPELGGGRALDGGEDGIEEVRGGGVREEVPAEECGERELEARGGGGLEAADPEEGEAGGGEEGEAAPERGIREEEAAVQAGVGDAGDGGVGACDETGDARGVEGGVGGDPGNWGHGERRRSVGLASGGWGLASSAASAADDGPVAAGSGGSDGDGGGDGGGGGGHGLDRDGELGWSEAETGYGDRLIRKLNGPDLARRISWWFRGEVHAFIQLLAYDTKRSSSLP
jgi:hypothetical protein